MNTHPSAWLKYLLGFALLTTLLLGIAVFFAESRGIPPRTLGAYLEKRSSGHNALIEGIGGYLGRTLISRDRPRSEERLKLHAPHIPTPPRAGATEVLVASSRDAIRALSAAHPGEVITFLPGHYVFGGKYIAADQPGTRSAPITVKAQRSGTVFLELATTEGFLVSAPYWTFENLNIRGVCLDHSNCEHAFHIVGGASHFSAYNNDITDFNAHFKINATEKGIPDDGILAGNTLSNSQARHTGNPVTPIDLVAASHWTIRDNLISDFVKDGGDGISYGAYAKGAGSDNHFVRNIVLCEASLRNLPGERIGLSLGGGGTGRAYCRDQRCITEQDGSSIESNLIASCSDDGIYINRAAMSKILGNTLIDTGGIVVRFPESSAQVEGNLVDGSIRSREDALLHLGDNLDTHMTALYLGYHPVRDLFVNAAQLNLDWRGQPPLRKQPSKLPGLCGTQPVSAYGAFDNFLICLAR